MSKSVGNVVTLREAVEEWGPETVLMLFLGAHWRKPMDYSDETLTVGEGQGGRLPRDLSQSTPSPGAPGTTSPQVLEDDFNTPEALAVMHEWRDHDLLRRGLDLFGLGSLAEEEAAPDELHELARQRAEVRAGGDYDEADRLRQEIEAAGWEVRDVAGEPGYQLVPKR